MPGQKILSEKYECRGGGEKQISTPSPENIMDQNTLAEGDGVPEGSSHTPCLSDRTPGCVSGKKQQRKCSHATRLSGGSLALVTIWEEPKRLTEGKAFPQPFSGHTLSL